MALGAAIEEQALLTISADNIRQNFIQNWGIADYGLNAPGLPVDKLLYTHFPSGPDIVLAIIRSFEISDDLIRHVYILIALSSVPILILLLNKVKMRPIFIGLVTSFYLLNYSAFWAYSTHFVFAFYFPFLFLGVIGLIKIHRREKNSYLFFIVFLTASYITAFVSFFTLVFSACAMGFFLKSQRKKILLTSIVSTCTLLLLHFLRNVLALGMNVASKDVLYTAGNRIFGFPTKSSVMEFFRVNQIAWWGTDNNSLSSLYEIMIQTISSHLGLISSVAIALGLKKLPLSRGMLELKPRKELEESQIFTIFAAGSLVWYLLFPHQGKNYYFPPMIHSFALFLIIACALLLESEVKFYRTKVEMKNFINLSSGLIFFLLVIPSVSFIYGRPAVMLNFSIRSLILIFVLLFVNVSILQFMKSKIAFSKTALFRVNALFSITTIFVVQGIEFALSIEIPATLKIFFAVGLFLASNHVQNFIFVSDNHKLRRNIAISLIVSLTFVNSFSVLQKNLETANEARAKNFYSSTLKGFNELPRLNGKIFTNWNAPLLFRYTGGRVVGYCKKKGLVEKDEKYCVSGRIADSSDAETQIYVVLSENFTSGDFACFLTDPCFEETLNHLSLSHKKIKSPPGFYIFEE